MTKASTMEHYLGDLGKLLLDAARKAKQARDASNASEREFYSGKLFAYYDVISLMQQQAEAFGLPLNVLSLEGIDPENDLL